MRVEVLFFAQVRDALGADRETMHVADGTRAGEVVEVLRGRAEWRRVGDLPIRLAVNESFVDDDHVLADGDRVALITPVSGG